MQVIKESIWEGDQSKGLPEMCDLKIMMRPICHWLVGYTNFDRKRKIDYFNFPTRIMDSQEDHKKLKMH